MMQNKVAPQLNLNPTMLQDRQELKEIVQKAKGQMVQRKRSMDRFERRKQELLEENLRI